VALLAGAALLAWWLGTRWLPTPERMSEVRGWIEAHDRVAPAVFVAGYVAAELLFVPALPLTLFGGLVFGPIRGTLYVSVAATLSATLACAIARYALRARVERWIASSPKLQCLDAAVAEHGWRILVVTRLVPLFPFNVQNFAYGLTAIRLRTFVVLSWVCMLPGTVAYTLAGAALGEGEQDPRRALTLLAIAGSLLVALSLPRRCLRRRRRAAAAILRP
jgi:uncharacterized membrane protein YdjX (TVP38/TMEM64 family)